MYYDKIEDLSLTFFKGTYDWINFGVSIGDRSIRTRFWAYCDPLPRFKRWLEAICIGVEQCSFSFDAEGDDLKFSLEQTWRASIFQIGCPYASNEKWLLEGRVDHVQLVREFYLGFLTHRNSPLFNHDGWETEYLWERLVRNMDVPRDGLVEALLPLDRGQLDELWFDAVPKTESVIDIDFERFGLDDPYGNCETNDIEGDFDWSEHLIIPLDYDERSLDFKRDLIEGRLDRKWNGREGSKLIDFRSEVIERFLEQHKNTANPRKSVDVEGS